MYNFDYNYKYINYIFIQVIINKEGHREKEYMDIKGIKITKSMYIFILCSFVYNLLLSFMYIDSKDINTLIINIYGNIDLLNLN